MSKLKTYTVDDIRWQGPCYDPVTGKNKYGAVRRKSGLLAEEWTGSLLDILNVEDCPKADRLWVVMNLLPAREQRLLACQLLRRTPLTDERTVWDLLLDERSRVAVEMSERFARGEVSQDELDNARSAARDVSETPGVPGGTAFSLASWSAKSDLTHSAYDLTNFAALMSARNIIGADAWSAALEVAQTAQIEIVRAFLLQEEEDA